MNYECHDCWAVIKWKDSMIKHIETHIDEYDNCADTCRLEKRKLLKDIIT
jgi:hypothetical protein